MYNQRFDYRILLIIINAIFITFTNIRRIEPRRSCYLWIVFNRRIHCRWLFNQCVFRIIQLSIYFLSLYFWKLIFYNSLRFMLFFFPCGIIFKFSTFFFNRTWHLRIVYNWLTYYRSFCNQSVFFNTAFSLSEKI